MRRGATCGAAPPCPAGSEPVVLAPAPTAPVADPAPPLPVESTAVHTPVPVLDLAAPAGLEPVPADAPATKSFRLRGRLRRRLRYLRRVRELGFRDLGGLLFDLHRFGRDGTPLVAAKLAALRTVDAELRALELALDDHREATVLREPGIAACPRCATLHGSDANFCPNCGIAFSGPQPISEVGRPVAEPPAGSAIAAPAASLSWAPVGDPAAGPGVVRAADAGAAPLSSGEQPTTVEPVVPAAQPGTGPAPASPAP